MSVAARFPEPSAAQFAQARGQVLALCPQRTTIALVCTCAQCLEPHELARLEATDAADVDDRTLALHFDAAFAFSEDGSRLGRSASGIGGETARDHVEEALWLLPGWIAGLERDVRARRFHRTRDLEYPVAQRFVTTGVRQAMTAPQRDAVALWLNAIIALSLARSSRPHVPLLALGLLTGTLATWFARLGRQPALARTLFWLNVCAHLCGARYSALPDCLPLELLCEADRAALLTAFADPDVTRTLERLFFLAREPAFRDLVSRVEAWRALSLDAMERTGAIPPR